MYIAGDQLYKWLLFWERERLFSQLPDFIEVSMEELPVWGPPQFYSLCHHLQALLPWTRCLGRINFPIFIWKMEMIQLSGWDEVSQGKHLQWLLAHSKQSKCKLVIIIGKPPCICARKLEFIWRAIKLHKVGKAAKANSKQARKEGNKRRTKEANKSLLLLYLGKKSPEDMFGQ